MKINELKSLLDTKQEIKFQRTLTVSMYETSVTEGVGIFCLGENGHIFLLNNQTGDLVKNQSYFNNFEEKYKLLYKRYISLGKIYSFQEDKLTILHLKKIKILSKIKLVESGNNYEVVQGSYLDANYDMCRIGEGHHLMFDNIKICTVPIKEFVTLFSRKSYPANCGGSILSGFIRDNIKIKYSNEELIPLVSKFVNSKPKFYTTTIRWRDEQRFFYILSKVGFKITKIYRNNNDRNNNLLITMHYCSPSQGVIEIENSESIEETVNLINRINKETKTETIDGVKKVVLANGEPLPTKFTQNEERRQSRAVT